MAGVPRGGKSTSPLLLKRLSYVRNNQIIGAASTRKGDVETCLADSGLLADAGKTSGDANHSTKYYLQNLK
jgi:hypothetical protein